MVKVESCYISKPWNVKYETGTIKDQLFILSMLNNVKYITISNNPFLSEILKNIDYMIKYNTPCLIYVYNRWYCVSIASIDKYNNIRLFQSEITPPTQCGYSNRRSMRLVNIKFV
jgi:hypothetical protein